MIESGSPLISGNAVLLQVKPADGIVYSQVLRRTALPFTGPNDSGAALIFQGSDCEVPDLTPSNGIQYYYKDYGYNGSAFVDDGGAPLPVTPAANYVSEGPDVRVVVKQRFDVGLQQELARGLLKIKGSPAKIPVLMAPPVFKDTPWPVLSVLVNNDAPTSRGIGETILDGIGETDESMLSTYSLQIDSWSQSADERHLLHESMRRILLANLSVLTMLGFVQMEWRITDVNFLDPAQFSVPVYCASLIFNFQAPTGIVSQQNYEVITAVDVIANILINDTVLDTAGAI